MSTTILGPKKSWLDVTEEQLEEVNALIPPHLMPSAHKDDTDASPSSSTPLIDGPDAYCVLLYYYYAPLGERAAEGSDEKAPTLAELRSETESLCSSRNLCGRIRISKEGLNGTVGGRFADVAVHVIFLRHHSHIPNASAINFKFGIPDPSRPMAEQRMKGLSVKLAGQVVTLLPNNTTTQMQDAVDAAPIAQHVTPEEWHHMLQSAGGDETTETDELKKKRTRMDGCGASESHQEDSGGDASKSDAPSTVLLDVRNRYETAVGHFDAPEVLRIDPNTRQFTDFPAFVEANAEKFRDKHVMMYCTGGVRCERGSAVFRALAPHAAGLYQLENGIHAYLDAYPEGGYFKGRNFVFDERMAVPPPGRSVPEEVCGTCAKCATPWDDYTLGHRCSKCRIRMLVCRKCSESGKGDDLVCPDCPLV